MRSALQIGVWAWVLVSSTAAWGQSHLDAALRDSRNGVAHLSQFRGRPVVLIYEGKSSMHVNEAFKRELTQRVRRRQPRSSAQVIAVADLHAYNFFPARAFALKAVRRAEQKEHVPVLLDWDRSLTAHPWGLPSDIPSVVILDAQGTRVYSHSGPMRAGDAETFFGCLSGVTHEEYPGLSTASR